MLILAIDVGKGTEDVMLFFEDEPIENSIQLVLPSTAQIMAKAIREDKSEILIISGELMAGEPWHTEVYKRCRVNSGSVIMSTTAARSLRYNLGQVQSKGVKIVPDDEIENYEGSHHFTTDINWKRIFGLLEASAIDRTEISVVLLASQDHGEPLVVNQSMRDFRMKTIYKPLEGRAHLEDLMFISDTVPDTLPRHKSMVKSAKSMFTHLKPTEIGIMDSSPAVVYGASDASNEKELVVNVGNGHTIAVFFEKTVVNSVYELHTGGVKLDYFAADLKLVANRELSHEETLEKGGHGIFYNQELESVDFSSYLPLTLIGPHRDKLSTLNSVKVHPGGSMMMAGPVGLIRAFNEKKT